MCLSTLRNPVLKAKLIEEAKKRGYFKVYKVTYRDRDSIKSAGPCVLTPYRSGKQTTTSLGWHVFFDKQVAEEWAKRLVGKLPIKVCYAKVSWLKRIGIQLNSSMIGATFYTLVFPNWDKGDMTVREFREACKRRNEK